MADMHYIYRGQFLQCNVCLNAGKETITQFVMSTKIITKKSLNNAFAYLYLSIVFQFFLKLALYQSDTIVLILWLQKN